MTAVAAVLLMAGVAHAAPPGTWRSTGSMLTGGSRVTSQAVTLLPDGRVLSAAYPSQIYNPRVGSWAPTAPPPINLFDVWSAVTLSGAECGSQCGKVLVVHRPTSSGDADSAIYDPVADTWQLTGTRQVPQDYGTTSLLATGEVLLAGGVGPHGYMPPITNAVQVYSPQTGSWRLAAPMPEPRTGHTATVLANGSVLVAAGNTGYGGSNTAAVYNPAQGLWLPTPPMKDLRTAHAAAALADGRVLVAGGIGTDIGSPESIFTILRTAEIYDPFHNTWTPTTSMTNPRLHASLTVLQSGAVLAAGGDVFSEENRTSELYDPAGAIWHATGPMNAQRIGHAAVRLSTGRVLAAGGEYQRETSEVYRPAT